MAKRAFGELESEILSVLQGGKRMSVKEVHQALGGGNSYNTVMTVMSRLAEKKDLQREKMGLHYEYWMGKSGSFLDKLKSKFLGVKTSILVSHLLETADDLSETDLKEMENILKKIKGKK